MRFPLLSGAYQSRSIIASAQRCVNLYPESNQPDPQAPVPITHYPTPGTVLYSYVADNTKPVRATYRTSLGTAYVVIGVTVYLLASNAVLIPVGSVTDRPTQIIMADNGLAVVLVDGTQGWVIDMSNNSFAEIIDPSFYGADFVQFLDTFFVFNRPDTNQFYISASMADYALLSGTAIGDGTITNAGSGYVDDTYEGVPLTGGSGTGATADITVSGNEITQVNIVDIGVGYNVGDVLSADNANLGGTGQDFAWTITSFALAFDPLDIAAKSGSADPIVAILTVHRELWLIGQLTSEVWIGTGAPDFYFQQQQGAYIDHGCIAPYSAASLDVATFWLMQDKQGKGIVVKGVGYAIEEISTPAIVAEFQRYVTISDAIGMCYQQSGHAFYILTFPRANKTWACELKTGQWHELVWTDENGNENRHRMNCCMFANGKNIIGDWENGNLYSLEPEIFTDNGQPIKRLRTFPHLIKDGKRVNYRQFIVDMAVGSGVPEEVDNDPPKINLRWSDDRGRTFGNPVVQSAGVQGDYLKQISYQRLGMARDRVFEVSWASPFRTALNGAFVEAEVAAT